MVPFSIMESNDKTKYLWSFAFTQGVGLGKVFRLDKGTLEI